ncbi:efflux RND transporter permease subunit [Quisquiliibacterium transsilvanicum]|uniref:Cobalt-zinc-cadmium resistance protein CzcA n=1 Tax=Quisquiliibacterium transsilvanicum TaxID=1549638 RepID=A0A7W8M9S9_9BURK|nr:CusA/CzcA family heavy metal efflux RND transporter [Quisquiliibacterium transsilvanicum]MBB5273356.1 cobalt-zinc-cadmium resistance protein CzcA [Quisquiliibacterium transsilvanicum]
MIRSLIAWALKQRIVVAVVALAVAAFGVLGLRGLAVDAFPDVTNVQVQIGTESPGRAPAEVERFVTVPIENAMRGMPGLVEMRSLNRNGLSLITLVFTDDTDVYFARQVALERLIEVADRMPEGATPVLGPVSSGLGEVYQYTLEHPSDGDRELSVDELKSRRDLQDWVVRPLLRSIPGVAEVNSHGGYVRQYQVIANPERLRHYGFTIRDLYGALARNNANSSGGALPVRAEQYLIRGEGLIASLDDIRNIVLKEVNGTPVYVRDVAEVRFGQEVRRGAILRDGVTESVAGIVQMQRGGNAREVVQRVKARVEQINAQSEIPGGLQIVPFYDRTDLVDAALLNVSKVLVEGVVLVIAVLFVFLGDVRSSVIVVATLLLTPLMTFLVMGQIGLSANLMSLGGLAIAIGLMVDGAVVVVENAYARLGKARTSLGLRKEHYILEAASEVSKPVLYGVGIIILVFLPLLSLQGMEGRMFAPLALTIAIALTISLVLSFTLTPALSSFLLKGGKEEDTWLLRKIKHPYLRALDWSLGNGRKVILGALGLMAAAIACIPLLGTAFIPTMKEGSLTPVIVRAPNISLDESLKLEREALAAIATVPGVARVVSRLGGGESSADPGLPHESDPIATLKPRDQWPDGWTQDDIADAIREKLRVLPGVEVAISQPIAARVDEMVSGVRSQVAIKIFGDDLAVLREKGDAIARVLSSLQGTTDLRVERVTGQNYLTVQIDRSAIARYGINVEDVNDLIESAVRGRVTSTVFEGERRYDLFVRYPESSRNNVEAVSSLLLRSPGGALVPLNDVAEIRLVDGPPQIAREDGRRRLVIGANVVGRDLGGYVAEAQARIASDVPLPEGYRLEWGGQFENMERALERLSVIIPMTIAAIFFLLFMLFDSVRQAALIITVLPLAAIGGVFGLLLSGEYLSVPAAVGFINLWGIAVLNGVVLISQIRSLLDQGHPLAEAIREGCEHRFRPVMMTATVAMLALIPMLFSSGPGSEVTRPLAVVVIGGLITSTSLTLLVLPVLYSMLGMSKESRRLSRIEAEELEQAKARRAAGAAGLAGTGGR